MPQEDDVRHCFVESWRYPQNHVDGRACWRHLYDNQCVVAVYYKSVSFNPLTPLLRFVVDLLYNFFPLLLIRFWPTWRLARSVLRFLLRYVHRNVCLCIQLQMQWRRLNVEYPVYSSPITAVVSSILSQPRSASRLRLLSSTIYVRAWYWILRGVLWWACLSVCVCVCSSAIITSELHVRSAPKFLCMLPMVVARSLLVT